MFCSHSMMFLILQGSIFFLLQPGIHRLKYLNFDNSETRYVDIPNVIILSANVSGQTSGQATYGLMSQKPLCQTV